MFLAKTFSLILISTELFSCLPHPRELYSIFYQILAVWICMLNLNKYNLWWQINVFDYCHYGCPGVLDSQNLWNSYVCAKGVFGIRRERLRNSLNVYPTEKRRKSSRVYLFRFPARNVKQVSFKRNWKAYQNMLLTNICGIFMKIWLLHRYPHTAVYQWGPSNRSPTTSRSRPLFLVAFNIYLSPQYDH
jgi:hypothetical protein